MAFQVIIPATYNSKRFPGKVLIDIAGKPMLQHVYERALESGADSIVIATDDDRIQKVAETFGATVCRTSTTNQSGTECLAEAVEALAYPDDAVVVNVQADEPLIPPTIIHQVAQDLVEHETVSVATLCQRIVTPEDIFNPSIVKVVMNKRGYALYFSRAPIPWERDVFLDNAAKFKGKHYRHIGLYAYRVKYLQEYVAMDACPLEDMEKLEQLRVLWAGGRIHVGVVDVDVPPSVDTEEDVEKIMRALA